MAIAGTRPAVAAGGAAVKVLDQGDRVAPMTATISNVGANPCDIGGPTLAVGAGYPLAANASVTVTLHDDDDEVYAASTLGTTLAILAQQ